MDGRWPEPAEPLPLNSEPPPADELSAEPTLQHIGRYALKRKLGEGGLGNVHEAWDPLLSRTVAVKTLQFDVDPPERLALDRLFLNEARAVAGLNHPHIVTVHDAGLSAHGVYIAMERLRGRDLRQAIASGWRPRPGQAAYLVRRVADALAYAHARGVVHCDIKPANIFLTGKDKPTVLDFGIARIAHGAQCTLSAAQPALDGLVAGSPHYLAPEQLQGGTIDGRTDVYSLGVVLYELLAGRKAFEGDSLQQITNAVLHVNPAPADALQPAVPAGLAAVASKAMARDPAERFASAAEFALALRPWQERTSAEEPRKGADPGQRRRLLVLLPMLGAAMALGAASTWWWHAPADAPASTAIAVAATPPAAAALVPPVEATPAEDALANDAAASAPDAVPSATTVAEAPPPPTAAKPRPRPARTKPAAPAPTPTAAPPAMGTVRLAISPWGEIEVNGQPAGLTPPLATLTLPAGSHRITVRNGDFPPYSTQVDVDADQPVTLRHRFGS
ncbi:PEGA domain-containing protein [Rubrivivax albus]|uniref:PEGA domain-containing protein n=2 Tax=Rubrivivax albus TaxID=2499835 RepID=A0A3S2VVE7_9BURK|nr:PEGA domain-containing protein [Rubrivivax albus]